MLWGLSMTVMNFIFFFQLNQFWRKPQSFIANNLFFVKGAVSLNFAYFVIYTAMKSRKSNLSIIKLRMQENQPLWINLRFLVQQNFGPIQICCCCWVSCYLGQAGQVVFFWEFVINKCLWTFGDVSQTHKEKNKGWQILKHQGKLCYWNLRSVLRVK